MRTADARLRAALDAEREGEEFLGDILIHQRISHAERGRAVTRTRRTAVQELCMRSGGGWKVGRDFHEGAGAWAIGTPSERGA